MALQSVLKVKMVSSAKQTKISAIRPRNQVNAHRPIYTHDDRREGMQFVPNTCQDIMTHFE